jgi:hypothetical protein
MLAYEASFFLLRLVHDANVKAGNKQRSWVLSVTLSGIDLDSKQSGQQTWDTHVNKVDEVNEVLLCLSY